MAVRNANTVKESFLEHPRLYFSAKELVDLRKKRDQKVYSLIWANMKTSADWCLIRPIREEWIAPVDPDPIYANLYDRFFAMMHDMTVMEHLAFAWAYSGDARYLERAKAWTLACCRVWKCETEGEPDGGNAYAVTRLLKGVATAYDIIYEGLSKDEREEIRRMLVEVGGKYYRWYLDHPTLGTLAGQGPHHASVETTSFGIAALTLLGDVPEAADWLKLMVEKHRQSLLPEAIASDGAQVEGSTFRASTMQYRIAFMDSLRRVTGEDLFTPFAKNMDARLAFAKIAASKTEGYDQVHETVVLEPSYGQINYYSPLLVALAREYRNPLCQHLALWDKTIGGVQKTRYITDNGEWMLFSWGGYAFVWYDPTVPAVVKPDVPLSFAFPSVTEAYLRDSYDSGGIVAGLRRNEVVVHAGGRPVYASTHALHKPPATVNVSNVTLGDDGNVAHLTCNGEAGSGFSRQEMILRRPGRLTFIRDTDTAKTFWCYGHPAWQGNVLQWEDGTTLEVERGTLDSLDPSGYRDEIVVGLGKLKLVDPHPTVYPLIKVSPASGKIIIQIKRDKRGNK
ncbi:MAG: DUF4962 domain-containing protein [Phycisphaerae bacterium]